MPDSREIAKIFRSTNLDDYRPFFDEKIHGILLENLSNPDIIEIVEQLILLWNGASAVRSMSWLSVLSISEALNAMVGHYEPLPISMLKNLANKIDASARIAGLEFSPIERSCIAFEIKSAEKQARERLNDMPPVMDVREAWKEYSSQPHIRIALWHAELSAFSQVYFANENFYLQFSNRIWGTDFVLIKDVGKEIKSRMGHEVLNDVFYDERVTFARLVRNSVTHYGARMTNDLKPFRHMVVTDDKDLISIVPNQTSELYSLLCGKIKEFLNKSKKG